MKRLQLKLSLRRGGGIGNLLRNGVFHLLFRGPGQRAERVDVAGVAPVAHGGPQEDGGEMVAADEGSFDPGEQEDDDLPAAVLADQLKKVLELDHRLPILLRVVRGDNLGSIL